MKTKICIKCERELLATTQFFYKEKNGKFGLKSRCKECCRKYEQSEKGKEISKKYRQTEKYKVVKKKYRQSEKGKLTQKKADKKRYEKNKLSCCVSRMISHSLNGNKNGLHWENLVSYTLQDLKQHLEFLFQEGMSWENYGQWHIDHKRPISSFNITNYDCEDFKNCWSLENLQPLWAKDNLRKSNKIV